MEESMEDHTTLVVAFALVGVCVAISLAASVAARVVDRRDRR